jgi:hypothetical protein
MAVHAEERMKAICAGIAAATESSIVGAIPAQLSR